jgi:hypothetical protein
MSPYCDIAWAFGNVEGAVKILTKEEVQKRIGMCRAYLSYKHCIYLTYAAICLLVLALESTLMLVRISRIYLLHLPPM